jgi:hypothetical protein
MTQNSTKSEESQTKPIKHQTQILVSQKHIDDARTSNSSHCMIQRAIKTTNANAKLPSVDLQTIRWTDRRNNTRYIWLTPFTAQQALVRFDQGIPIQPFAFRLSPQPIAETDPNGHVAPRGGPRKAKKRRRVRVRHSGKGSISVTTENHPPPPIAALPGSRRRFGLRQLHIGLYDEGPRRKKAK